MSDSTSQSTDTLDQLTSFLKDLENESLSACAECTRRRLLDLVGFLYTLDVLEAHVKDGCNYGIEV